MVLGACCWVCARVNHQEPTPEAPALAPANNQVPLRPYPGIRFEPDASESTSSSALFDSSAQSDSEQSSVVSGSDSSSPVRVKVAAAVVVKARVSN